MKPKHHPYFIHDSEFKRIEKMLQEFSQHCEPWLLNQVKQPIRLESILKERPWVRRLYANS